MSWDFVLLRHVPRLNITHKIGDTDSRIVIQGLHPLYRCAGMESNGLGQYWSYAWPSFGQDIVLGGCIWKR